MSVGRVQRKLVALLQAEGFSSIEISVPQGHWRSSPYADVHRWEGSAVRAGDGVRTNVYSWETMTVCVKNGIQVSARNKGCSGNGYEVSARDVRSSDGVARTDRRR